MYIKHQEEGVTHAKSGCAVDTGHLVAGIWAEGDERKSSSWR